jgi:radical SAM protein with 4Fe4S-binding SPASM domain
MPEPKLSYYLHGKAAAAGRPCAGSFELTPRCCFDCKMCYVHLSQAEQERRGKELSTEQWLSVAQQALEEGLVFLLLTGGEPTLRPDFPELLSGLKRMGLLVSVNTNGYLLRGELLRRILQDPPYRFNITLYGTSDATYEALCGVPAYETVLQNIQALRQAGVDVKLNLTLTPENKADRAAIAEAARSLGAHLQTSAYLFPPVRVTGTTDFPQRLPPEEAGRLEGERLRETLSEAALAELRQTLSLPAEGEEACTYCRSGRSAFWLTWDGKLLPCGMLAEPGADVLRLGFSEAWRQVRDRVRSLQYPAACQRCRFRRLCHLCLAKCYCETLGYDRPPEYACRMTRALLRELNIPGEKEIPL